MKKFLYGALIGAGVALLYAPASGRSTRSKIRDKAVGLGNDATDFVNSKKQHLTNKMEGVKAKVRGMADHMKDMMPAHEEDMDRDMAMSGEPVI